MRRRRERNRFIIPWLVGSWKNVSRNNVKERERERKRSMGWQ